MKWLSFSVIALLSLPVDASQRVRDAALVACGRHRPLSFNQGSHSMKLFPFAIVALLSLPVAASQRVGVLHWWRAVGTGHSPSIKAVTV